MTQTTQIPDQPPARPQTAEHDRLADSPLSTDQWRIWGPYVSGRQWGTVREDYSSDGNAWDYFPFEQAHRRAYRWGEDGIAALCDRFGFFNLGLTLWNGRDDRLKERFFGLTGEQGNHGEDVKEVWWPTDATPTHSFATYLYRYPQAAFPYDALRAGAAARTKTQPEFELTDTGVLYDSRFFDVVVTYAKATATDVLIQIEVTNQGPDAAPIDIVPTGWFRNTWAWGRDDRTPTMQIVDGRVTFTHAWLGEYELLADDNPRILFCDNETDVTLWGEEHPGGACPKNGIDRAIVHRDESWTRSDHGTKVGFWWHVDAVEPGATVTVRLRLRGMTPAPAPQEAHAATAPATDAAPMAPYQPGPLSGGRSDAFGAGFDAIVTERHGEADEFYAAVIPEGASPEDRHIARRAFAGLCWGKQLYRYAVNEWLEGDPSQPTPAPERLHGRNSGWTHLDLADIISMPDEWEYPWFAAWDLAFHTLPLAEIDPAFAKQQIELMCWDWAQHPNGQLPAYEWNFFDVNPPVHAWAAWQVYEIDGAWDTSFLVRVLSKLLMNFSWWVNRKDEDGSYLFEGGFLGMDNISLFDRSQPLPGGARLEQSDATSWMAFYALSLLRIAVELARRRPGWDSVARTQFEYFLRLASAMDSFGTQGVSLWNEEDGFYYDTLVHPDGDHVQLPVRSLVGLLPLIAVSSIHPTFQDELPGLLDEVRWVQRRDPKLADVLVHHQTSDQGRVTMALVPGDRRARLLERLFDEAEFLSPGGIRSLSAVYRDGYTTSVDGTPLTIRYTPAESDSGMFGGNSNWRGPVWMPVNFLLLDALRGFAKTEPEATLAYPTGGAQHTLDEITADLSGRLIGLFRKGPDGRRPGTPRWYGAGPLWDEHVTFCEYFDGDDGSGLGATHQTGWSALVAHLICSPRGRRDYL